LNHALTLIVDGHNVLYALRHRFTAQLVDGHPGTAAREALVQRLLSQDWTPDQEVLLYFDGAEATVEARSPQLTVIYSGGQGEQRADRAILARLNEALGSGRDVPVYVVTLDRDLARRARKRGARVLGPAELPALSDSSTSP
jgi:predicted RNA-binding protein with PIN domain